jgi:tetratricopeptide (TPR) repeat protein
MNRHERRAAARQAKAGKNPAGGSQFTALYDAARGHMRNGRYLDAQVCCQQALAVDGNHADTLHLMGLLCIHTRQYDHAVAWLSRAIAREPKTLYLTTLGTVLLQLERGEEALAAFDHAVRLQPDDAELWSNRGLCLSQLKRTADAIASFQHALKLDPRHREAATEAARLLHQASRFAEALPHFNLCDELQPDTFQTLHLRADTLQKLGRLEEALADRRRAHLRDPANADACIGLANALVSLGRYEEALPWFDRALALREDVAHGLRSKAIALEQLGRFDDAIATYRRAKVVDPNEAEAEWNLALLRLRAGDFEAGWAGREWARRRIPALVAGYAKFSQPFWHGVEPVDGKTILVWPDEGLGDTIQFARYVPMLAARGARVILMVQDALYPLLSGLAGIPQCLPKSAALPAFDFHCPITSLPWAFETRLESIPAEKSYLPSPAADRVAAWEQRLGSHDRLRVGLVWSGNRQHSNDRNRSIPLRMLAPILDLDATFVSLQMEVRAEDRPSLRERGDIVDPTAYLTDFAETAALVSCLDLVITVDTSVAHLSGALGRPTWILLPCVADYRWLRDREDSPWYPTARLFRQDASRDYAAIVDRLRRELQSQIAAARSGSSGVYSQIGRAI